jgi:iron complex transport system substrate-binding protein
LSITLPYDLGPTTGQGQAATECDFGLLAGSRHNPLEPIGRAPEKTVETLYLLGEQDRIVGISGYVVRPPQARREKPRVSAFTSANIERILALQPDLVLTFSDLKVAADLIRRGIEVHAFNQRTIAGILDMIRMLGAMVGASERAEELVEGRETRLAEARKRPHGLPKRLRVFFEGWDDPLISAIGWAITRPTTRASVVTTSK